LKAISTGRTRFLKRSGSPRTTAERREPLLPVEEQLLATERGTLLFDRKIPRRHLDVGLPDEDRPRWITAVERIEQVADSRGWPDIASLKFG
jgi:hypothetical protein